MGAESRQEGIRKEAGKEAGKEAERRGKDAKEAEGGRTEAGRRQGEGREMQNLRKILKLCRI